MRARIHKPSFRIEFDGSPVVWNELLRPIFGGPEAPPDPVPAAAAAAAAPAVVPASVPAVAVAAPSAPVAPPIVRTVLPPAPPPPPQRPTGVRTWVPPRNEPQAGAWVGESDAPPRHERRRPEPQDDRDAERQPWRRRGGPEPEIRIEPSNDPDTLYDRLSTLESRRAEKDAVLAAVWFVGADQREVHEKEVEKHLAEHGGPVDLKIRPAFLKHINRTKHLEQGTAVGLVRLTRKGREQIRLLCGV